MIRLIISAVLMILGLVVFTTSIVGNFRFAYVLNRMQASSLSDTLGAMLIILSLIVASGLTLTSLKLVLMIAFLWFANPVAGHFLAKTEIISDEKIKEKCEVVHFDDI